MSDRAKRDRCLTGLLLRADLLLTLTPGEGDRKQRSLVAAGLKKAVWGKKMLVSSGPGKHAYINMSDAQLVL